MKRLVLSFSLVLAVFAAMAQSNKEVNWAFSAKKIADKTYEVHLTASINGDWHLYAQNVGVDGPVPTTFTFTKNPLLSFDGKVKELGKVIKKKEEVWGGVVNYYENTVDFVQIVKIKGSAKTSLAGKVEFMVCNDSKCLPPAEIPFSINVGG
jgi:DsbC/DsbD-like thiol-disulfide interchange protein